MPSFASVSCRILTPSVQEGGLGPEFRLLLLLHVCAVLEARAGWGWPSLQLSGCVGAVGQGSSCPLIRIFCGAGPLVSEASLDLHRGSCFLPGVCPRASGVAVLTPSHPVLPSQPLWLGDCLCVASALLSLPS